MSIFDDPWQTLKGAAGGLWDGASRGSALGSSVLAKGEAALTKGVHGAEDQFYTGTHGLAASTAGIPVVGETLSRNANLAADVASFNYEMAGGGIGAAATMVGGLANMALHPVDTLGGFAQMVEHGFAPGVSTAFGVAHNLVGGRSAGEALRRANPLDAGKRGEDARFWNGMKDSFVKPYQESLEQGRTGEAVGRGAADLIMTFMGGEIAEVVRGGEGGQLARARAPGGPPRPQMPPLPEPSPFQTVMGSWLDEFVRKQIGEDPARFGIKEGPPAIPRELPPAPAASPPRPVVTEPGPSFPISERLPGERPGIQINPEALEYFLRHGEWP